ncbi:decaprenyl-phosphate phosphoribosyltransferase, partial [Ilumatobacter sp.]|uniref:decaprenyl-phosphate phosphoribosyltransferase n=1 Tax=Ilumatobacter sp. TaxID=1967498 RepID=UPI0037539B2E
INPAGCRRRPDRTTLVSQTGQRQVPRSYLQGAMVSAVISGLIRTARPKQWLKNVLVFAAPGAAGVLNQGRELGLTIIVFVAFCFAASAVYYWNDLIDVTADRMHPTKRDRPIAAGDVPISAARAVGVIAPFVALGLAGLTGRWQTVAVIGIYLVVNLAYNFGLKDIPVVELLVVASGFVLRAGAGAVAVDVPMSRWFVLCTTFGSLFIVAGKRYAELNDLGPGAGTRATLEMYTVGYLRIVLSISCGAALLSYCVWAFETSAEADALGEFDFPFYELSIVPMLAALLQYLLVLEQGGGGAPEEVFTKDRILQILGLAWIVIYGIAVYAG